MSGTATRLMIAVAFLLGMLLMSESSRALRDDKIYKVMMICAGDCTELPELDALRDEIAGVLPPGPSTVWPVSASELASMAFDELPQFSFVIWHFRGSQDSTTSELEAAAERVLAAEVPAVIFDDLGFPISHAFGLVSFVDGGQLAEPICGHADTEAGGVFHHLLSEFIEIDSDEVLFNTPIDGSSTRVNYVARDAVDVGAYTRPVMSVGDYVGPYSCVSSEEDPSQVMVIANDRKRVAASGLYEHGVYDVPFLLHNMVDYVTAVGPESAMANWIDQPALNNESESILFSPGGQSVLVETDWLQSSRGFDFEVKRTYRSGAADLYSYLGENWYLNHDRYLVHDKLNGELHVHDGSGSVTTMVHVAGRDPMSGGGRDTYVAIGSSNTAIAAYYDYTEEHVLTRVSPAFGDFVPGDPTGNIEKCVATDHASDSVLEQWASGFVLRDAAGGLSFFEHHPIDDADPDGMAYGNQKLRTKGGSLEYYRLAYLEDRNGNRQDYYYAHTDGADPQSGDHATPEELLWCVVDTEDRGTFFEMRWAPTQMDGHVSGSQGPRLPWLERVFFFDDFEGGASSPSLMYSYLDSASGCGDSATYHGLLLDQVSLWRGGADETVYKLYDYDFSAYDDPDQIGCTTVGWGNHFVPLQAATDWVASPAAMPSTFFGYGEVAVDTCNATDDEDNKCGFKYSRFYQGALTSYVLGQESDAFPAEMPTEVEYRFGTRPGTPNHHDLNAPFGWVSTVKSGVGQTLVYNANFNVIEKRLWYTADRCPDEDDSIGPVDCTDLDLAEDPGACADWDTGWPQIPCEGQSWVWRYRYNHDGQLTWNRTPVWDDNKWIDTEIMHVFQWAVEHELGGIADDEAVSDQLLEFWEEFWPQRQWMANPVMSSTYGWEGQQIDRLTTYEPIFNQPLFVEQEGVQQRRFNYDYLAFNASPLSDAALFELMQIAHASGASWQLSACPYGDCRFNMLDPAAMPFGECLDPVAPGPLQDPHEGNLVCEEVRHTQSHGLSVGRGPAAATFEYDQWGRMTRTENLDDRVVLEEYDVDPPDGSVKTVSRVGFGASPAIQTRYFYDLRGQNVRKQMAVDGLLDSAGTRCVEERFSYNNLGRLVHSWVFEDDDCGSSGGEVVIREELYEYDAAGNLTASRTVRCPNDESCAAGATEVGDSLDHVKLYDSKRRNTWDCVEVEQSADPAGTVFTCTISGYGADDKLSREGHLDSCLVPDGDDIETALLACADGWLDLRFFREHGYDERRQRHRTRLIDPVGETADRITRTYHDVDGRLAAAHDAADSDCSGLGCNEPEWTVYEHDGLGRLRRTTIGLDGADPLGTPDAVATWYAHDVFDNLIRQTRGAPTTDGSTDRSLDDTEQIFDARSSLIVREDKSYPVGGSPDEADVTATFLSYDQNDRIELERKYNLGANIDLAAESYYDAYGRLQLVENESAGVDVTAVYHEHDHMGRVTGEQQMSYSQLSYVSDMLTQSALEYDGTGKVIYRAEVDTSDDPQPPNETFVRYDGLGFLVESVDPKGQPTAYYRNGLGRVTRLVELLPGESWYFTDGFGSDPAIYSQIQYETEYNGLGGVVRRTDHKGNTTAYTHNAFGEIVAVDMPGSTESEVFDNRYQKRFTLNGDGAITSIAHYQNYESEADEPLLGFSIELDRHNRPRTVRNGDDTELQTLHYDGNGNLVLGFDYNNAADEVDYVRTDRHFSTRGELLTDRTEIGSSDGVEAWETTASYSGGRLDRVTTPAGVEVRHDYISSSPMPRRVMVTKLAGDKYYAGLYYWVGEQPLRRYQFLAKKQYIRNRMDWGGVPTYDGFGRLANTDIRQYGDTYGTIARFSLAYNENGRLVSEDQTSGAVGRDIEYTLDDLDRVESYLVGDSPDQYYLDQSDNLRQAATSGHGQVNVEIDHGIADDGDPSTWGLNQVTAMTYLGYGGYERTFEYDPRGNLTFDLGLPEESSRSFTWDDHGRLVRVDQASDVSSTFAYDVLGRRVRKLVRHDPRRTDRHDYRMLGDDVVEEYRRLGWKDEELWVIVHDQTAVDRYLRWDRYRKHDDVWAFDESFAPVTDARNNVLAVRTRTGSTELEYNLYGEELEPDHGQYIPYRFSGRRYDDDTGLYYYRTRYYAPDLGRFLSVDSIGIWGDLNNYGNGYAYVGNMSNQFLDPFGMQNCEAPPAVGHKDGERDLLMKWMINLIIKNDKTGLLKTIFQLENRDAQKLQDKHIKKGVEERSQQAEEINELRKENAELRQMVLVIAADNDQPEEDPDADMVFILDENEGTICIQGCDDDPPEPPPLSYMTVKDSPGYLTKDDVKFLSATGRIRTEPRSPGDPIEYGYDKPGREIWAWRNRVFELREKRVVGDDGEVYFPEMPVAVHTDWENKLGLNNPGVVDPIRN